MSPNVPSPKMQLTSQAGYREGITDGKLSTLQEGFDDSFTSSVSPSRQLGGMRGRASALLALHTTLRPLPPSASSLLEDLRDLIRDLNKVKRAEVLPIDVEREEHERDEHGGEGDEHAFELEGNEKRDMEGLENALQGLGANGSGTENEGKREEELLEDLRMRLEKIELDLKAAGSA